MHISHVKISQILGVNELEFTPTGFNEIAGQNGTGKTSVLEAIKSTLGSGHDATLLRKGSEKGETVILLDDGTEIRRRITESNSTTEVRRDGKKVGRPAEAIKALTDMLSVNPVDFLRAPKKDRVRVLLESMPLEADVKKLEKIVGFEVKVLAGVHALHVINQVYTQVYDARTGTNRAVTEKKGTIKQLEQAIPPVPEGAEGDEAELQESIAEIDTTAADEGTRIDAKLSALRQQTTENISKLREELANAETETEKKVSKLREDLATMETRAATQRVKKSQEFAEQRAPLSLQLKSIQSNRELHARRAQTMETIGVMRTELESLTEEADAQTAALDEIEQYKSELLASLPIPGLEVKDGEISRDGVAFDRLNTAQQVDISVEIAKLRAGDLGVICVDGIELLDTASYEAFRDRALESDLQLFVTRVSDDDFEITSA